MLVLKIVVVPHVKDLVSIMVKVLRVNALNKLKRNGFTLGSFSYEDHPLKLGDLKVMNSRLLLEI